MTRQTIASGYEYEATYGYARAVRVGAAVFVSGTTARPPHLDGDAFVQMQAAVAIVRRRWPRPGRGWSMSCAPSPTAPILPTRR